MNCLAVSEPGPRYFHFPLDEPELGLDGRGYDDVYFKGIISEHKKTVKRNGIIRQVWETTQGVRNEPLDLRVYNLAAMKSCHFDWNRLYEAVTGIKREPETGKKVTQAPKRATNRGGHMKRPPMRKSRQMNVWG
jgi:phage terminase large subunit GpA-like protein